jgi:hypothetical protein
LNFYSSTMDRRSIGLIKQKTREKKTMAKKVGTGKLKKKTYCNLKYCRRYP